VSVGIVGLVVRRVNMVSRISTSRKLSRIIRVRRVRRGITPQSTAIEPRVSASQQDSPDDPCGENQVLCARREERAESRGQKVESRG
jgi:hypothetical protein